LKPAFRANGTITPAASSANADGAAALILAKRSLADRDGLPVLAEIKGHATHSQEPQWFTTAPIPAIRKLLDKVGWSVSDVDLFEINEAFAWWRWRRRRISAFPERNSTSMAAPAHSATRSAPPARD
jgi:acetyl-CoA C-acetyltransferase